MGFTLVMTGDGSVHDREGVKEIMVCISFHVGGSGHGEIRMLAGLLVPFSSIQTQPQDGVYLSQSQPSALSQPSWGTPHRHT